MVTLSSLDHLEQWVIDVTTIQLQKEPIIDVDALDIDALLEIPEIRAAYDGYVDIQRSYREAVFNAIRRSPDGELPDVSDLAKHYRSLLADQRVVIKHLVVKHT